MSPKGIVMNYRVFCFIELICLIHLTVNEAIIYAAEMRNSTLNVGDVIPEIEADSIEGLPVSFLPPQGKILLILLWNKESLQTENAMKEKITLFKRFHNHGLNALGILSGVSENEIDELAEKWQTPWVQVLDEAGEEDKLSQQLGVSTFPYNLLIDENGKILALNLQGEAAHEIVANCLGVSLNDAPTPKPPEEKREPFRPMNGYDPGAGASKSTLTDINALLGEPQERTQVEACKQNLRKISHALTDYRRDHDGELPNWLSDLYPDYLQDETILLCPHDPNPTTKYVELKDPKMKCSFLYQFAPVNVGARNYREWKTYQLNDYGDRTPVARYLGFSQPLSLSYGGEIYFSKLTWEDPFNAGINLESDDAKVRTVLRTLASALSKYKKDKGGIPNELIELQPDYIKDLSLFINPVTSEPLKYLFSAADPDARQQKFEQVKKYGEYTPVIRVSGVLKNNRELNLAYNGEIYQSDEEWENLFHDSIDTALTDAGKKAISATGARSFYGIGATLLWDEENHAGFQVTGFTSDSPAEKAGLQAGDLIYAVSGESFGSQASETENFTHALSLLRSDQVSAVTLTVARPREQKPLTFAFPRTLISWTDNYFRGRFPVFHSDQMLPMRGQWTISTGFLQQNDPELRLAISIFEPFIKKGEISFKTRVLEGEEGVRILFGYSSPNHFYSLNLGGWNNSRVEIEKWMGVFHDSPQILVHAGPEFSLEHNRWHEVRLILNETENKVACFVNDQEITSYEAPEAIKGRFGLCTWKTKAEFQGIELSGE